MRKAGSAELNPTRCENVKRLLLVRRRNTIHVTLAAPFIFLGGDGNCASTGEHLRKACYTL